MASPRARDAWRSRRRDGCKSVFWNSGAGWCKAARRFCFICFACLVSKGRLRLRLAPLQAHAQPTTFALERHDVLRFIQITRDLL